MVKINDKINSLTVKDKYIKNNRTHYLCICECGKEIEVRSGRLNSKKSCGCKNEIKYQDITNQRFGYLVAIKKVERKHNKTIWLCHCDCGKNVEKSLSSLKTCKDTISCGCQRHIKGNTNKLYKGCGNLTGHRWSSIRKSAKNRKLEFTITIQYAWDLLVKQDFKCAISGLDIILYDHWKRGNNTASLDRIDSNKGYVEENVQWVHKHINKIKQDFDEEYFKYLCSKIYQHNKDCIEPVIIPDWSEYFLKIAIDVSLRSKDAQTKHGCVITTKQHRIIGTGYNSFVTGMPDDILANQRPKKYKNILHSEENAISNCIVSPHMFPDGCTAYITGKPCHHCLMMLAQNNINEIYVLDRKGWEFDKDEIDDCNLLIQTKKIKYQIVELN